MKKEKEVPKTIRQMKRAGKSEKEIRLWLCGFARNGMKPNSKLTNDLMNRWYFNKK